MPADLKSLSQQLTSAGVDHPEREIAQIRQRSGEDQSRFDAMVSRRLKREPLERIFGEAEFCGLTFKMDQSVFKPGFETETTMEYGLLFLQQKTGPVHILDLGTGTGCILLSLLHHLPNATGLGVDCNDRALELARKNAAAHNLSGRAEFQKTDWMDGIDGQFDLIISNPPRIPTQAIPHLVREVSEYDPKEALDGGSHGLEFYARTAQSFRRLAKPDGLGVLQVGSIVAAQALETFRRHGYTSATIKRDYKTSPNSIVFENDPEQLSWIGRFRTHLRFRNK